MIDVLARLRAYASSSGRLARERPDCFRPAQLVRRFPAWWSSVDGSAGPFDAPWLCFAATDLLRRYLRPDMRVFEWGSGGSTLFFARRAARVWSVEHDAAWFHRVRERLAHEGLDRCELRLVEPEAAPRSPAFDPADPTQAVSGSAGFRDATFARYVGAIAEHADRSLDVVLVDGRARPACCRAAMPKVKVGGYLVLDNAEVPYYRAARALLASHEWALTDVYGPLPGVRHFSETCLWRRAAP